MKKQSKETPTKPAAQNYHICLPFKSELRYARYIANTARYRKYLDGQFKRQPELFPAEFSQGYHFHSRYLQKKTTVSVRRIRLKSNSKAVFAIRPSFLMPNGVGRTDEMEKALFLLLYGVPFSGLAYVFGRDASYWQRAFLQLGRPSLVGTTVKDPEKLPTHVVADEKVTWLNGQEVYVTTTAAAGCVLGAGLALVTTTEAFEAGYGEFKKEARELSKTYAPETVCTDGYKSTRLAWQQLFPQVALILCFLHGVLKVMERCTGQLRQQVLDRVWNCYEAQSHRQFSQRLRRLGEWGSQKLSGHLQEMVLKLQKQRPRYATAYAHKGAHRTTNAVDRLMNHQDRMLYARDYLHGEQETARLALRAMAILWNFHPYTVRLRQADPQRQSPFADLNGFQYHENWLHNFLIAAKRSGVKT
ncbi:MAG: hypothetical protein J2P41_03190 [Blastocatellia bacterium]|nr:hypothetical protein [Blastocatellia bacterium]